TPVATVRKPNGLSRFACPILRVACGGPDRASRGRTDRRATRLRRRAGERVSPRLSTSSRSSAKKQFSVSREKLLIPRRSDRRTLAADDSPLLEAIHDVRVTDDVHVVADDQCRE